MAPVIYRDVVRPLVERDERRTTIVVDVDYHFVVRNVSVRLYAFDQRLVVHGIEREQHVRERLPRFEYALVVDETDESEFLEVEYGTIQVSAFGLSVMK